MWIVAGHYVTVLALERDAWRITSLTLETFYQDGNLELPGIAAGRARTDPRRPAAG